MAVIAILFACERAPSPVSPATTPSIAQYVTDDVAQSLTEEGRLILAAAHSLDGSAIISEVRARQLAAAYLRSYARYHLAAWESQRGAKISLAALSVAPEAYLAQTPYSPVPAGLHPSAKKLHGPYYVVPLLEKGVPAVLLAVSAYNTDMTIEADGQLTLPRLDGNSFPASGVPTSMSKHASLSPEEAVTNAARASRRKVARLPELVLPGARVLPIFALWKVGLDGDVTVTRKGRPSSERVQEVFIGRLSANDVRRPSVVQPLQSTGTTSAVDQEGRVGGDVPYRVLVRPGQVVEYEPVSITPEDL